MFRPVRTSSPSKSSSAAPALSIRDDSRSSIAELTGLESDEVEFIDAVVARAGPAATTFLAVLKAYNEILRERGQDSQSEVVYYGKLLKLGTLKGKNWGEKWDAVKSQNGYPNRHRSGSATSTDTSEHRPAVRTRLTGGFRAIGREDDTFTIHSHQDDDATETGSVQETPRPKARTLSSLSPASHNALGLDTRTPLRPSNTRTSGPFRATPIPISRRPQLWESISDAESVENVPIASTSSTPVSYGAKLRERTAFTHTPTPLRETRPKSAPAFAAPTESRRAVEKAREQRGNVLNDDDAWKNIRMAQDEEEADRFREEKLVERCWSVWRQGYEWTTVRLVFLCYIRYSKRVRLDNTSADR